MSVSLVGMYSWLRIYSGNATNNFVGSLKLVLVLAPYSLNTEDNASLLIHLSLIALNYKSATTAMSSGICAIMVQVH